VNAVELLGGEAPFIADTSAWWRFSSLPDELAGLIKLTDALIASAAAEHGGIAVLHRDAHFDKLAEVLTFENVELPGS
jgi:predicted nucleic acid-binding protein